MKESLLTCGRKENGRDCKKAAPMRDGWLHYHLSDGDERVNPSREMGQGNPVECQYKGLSVYSI